MLFSKRNNRIFYLLNFLPLFGVFLLANSSSKEISESSQFGDFIIPVVISVLSQGLFLLSEERQFSYFSDFWRISEEITLTLNEVLKVATDLRQLPNFVIDSSEKNPAPLKLAKKSTFLKAKRDTLDLEASDPFLGQNSPSSRSYLIPDNF